MNIMRAKTEADCGGIKPPVPLEPPKPIKGAKKPSGDKKSGK